MLTKAELEYYERTPNALDQLVEEVRKLREAVEKCTGRPVPTEEKTPVKTEHPKDSPFEVLAVTNVEVFPFKGGATLGHMKGMAKIILNDQLVIQGLRIIETDGGELKVEYPPSPFPAHDGDTIIFTTSNELRDHISYSVLSMYAKLTK